MVPRGAPLVALAALLAFAGPVLGATAPGGKQGRAGVTQAQAQGRPPGQRYRVIPLPPVPPPTVEVEAAPPAAAAPVVVVPDLAAALPPPEEPPPVDPIGALAAQIPEPEAPPPLDGAPAAVAEPVVPAPVAVPIAVPTTPPPIAPVAPVAVPVPPPSPPPVPPPSRPERSVMPAVCVENSSIEELQAALASGQVLSVDITRAYLARIEAYDRAGPGLNSVREVNPEALALASAADASRVPRNKRPPLHGIPILLKDNIATSDEQHTTAGSLALADAYAKRDATIAAKLRRAGAVLIGKANLTEFANILAVGMPSGYSSLGGQVRNAYAPELDAKGVPIVGPGGSSAGSGVAVAAGFAAAAIGTETSGSLLSPASQSGVVTVKPTVGLISRAGIIPIAASQDTAGPMTRTVRDAALILNALAGPDLLDPATAAAPKTVDYLKNLSRDGLKGARIGIPSNPDDPANDVYWRTLSPAARAVMERAIQAMQDAGASIIRENIPTPGWIGGPGTDMAILNRNPESPDRDRPTRLSIVFVYELKHDLNAYLRDWARGTTMRSLSDIVSFNFSNADRALRFGQDIFLAAQNTRGDLKEAEYIAARQSDLRAARTQGLDTYMEENQLDAVLFPGTAGASIAAKAGYPSVQVPAGFISGINGRETPEYPLGATFTGRAWSEATLLRIAYAFEQITQARRMPPNVPSLVKGCAE